jgi:hypothetical protein
MLSVRIGGVDVEAEVREPTAPDFFVEPVPLECELEAMTRVVIENPSRSMPRTNQIPIEVFLGDRELVARTLEIIRVELLCDLSG